MEQSRETLQDRIKRIQDRPLQELLRDITDSAMARQSAATATKQDRWLIVGGQTARGTTEQEKAPITTGGQTDAQGQATTPVTDSMPAHLASPNPHPQYLLQKDYTRANGVADVVGTGTFLREKGQWVAYSPFDPSGLQADIDGKLDREGDSYVTFSTSPTGVPTAVGTMSWNSEDGTMDLQMEFGVTQQIGQELFVHAINKSGVTIPNGSVVYLEGAQAGRPSVALADASIHAKPIGIATMDIANNAHGFVTINGMVRNIATGSFAEGAPLYLSLTPGQLTDTPPAAPAATIQVGVVSLSHPSLGSVLVAVQGDYALRIHEHTQYAMQMPIDDGKLLSGFADNANITVSYDSAQRRITLTHPSGSIRYHYRGKEKTLASPWTSSAHSNTSGNWFLYSEDGDTFFWSNVAWKFEDVMVSYVRKGTNLNFALRETHGLMDPNAHRIAHANIGTYVVSGGTLTAGTYAIGGTASDASNTPGLDTTVISDEDILTTIPALAEGSYRAVYPVTATDFGFSDLARPFSVGASYIQWYNGTVATEGATGKYYVVYAIGLPTTADAASQLNRWLWTVPQKQYDTLAQAQASTLADVNLCDLALGITEYIPRVKLIYGSNASYATTGKVRLEDATYLVKGTSATAVATGTTTSWNNLADIPEAIAAIDNLPPAADKLAYYTGANTAALTTFTAFMRTLLDDADAATARATLGAQVAGSYANAIHSHAIADVTGLQTALDGKQAAGSYQPLDSDLTAIAALTTSAFGRGLLPLADAAAVRTYIGAGAGNGSVTSVAMTAAGPLSVGGSPVTGSGTLALTWSGSSANLVRADGSVVASNSFQSALGFTPVQQGGGTSQTTNKLYIGWSAGSALRLQVDTTDFGSTWPISISGISADSSRLGNQLPSYYAPESVIANLGTIATDPNTATGLQSCFTQNTAANRPGDYAFIQTMARYNGGSMQVASDSYSSDSNNLWWRRKGDNGTWYPWKTIWHSGNFTPGNYQPLDSDLTAIAALATTAYGRGFLPLADAAAARTYIGAQAAGSYQPLDADLTAVAALATTGFVRRTAADTWSASAMAWADISGIISYGSSTGTVCQGNDSRLADARTPTAHVLDSTTHTISGKTAGQVLLATGATTYAFTAISGDATLSGAGVLTLASTITAAGPVGGAATIPVITYDAKGRLTAVTTAAITPAAIGAQVAGSYLKTDGSNSMTGTLNGTTAIMGSASIGTTTGVTSAWFGYSGRNSGGSAPEGFNQWSDGGIVIGFSATKTAFFHCAGSTILSMSGSSITANVAFSGTSGAFSGTLTRGGFTVWDAGNLAFGTGNTNMARGDHSHSGVYQPIGNYVTLDTTQTITAIKTFQSSGSAPISITGSVPGISISTGYIAGITANDQWVTGTAVNDVLLGSASGRVTLSAGGVVRAHFSSSMASILTSMSINQVVYTSSGSRTLDLSKMIHTFTLNQVSDVYTVPNGTVDGQFFIAKNLTTAGTITLTGSIQAVAAVLYQRTTNILTWNASNSTWY